MFTIDLNSTKNLVGDHKLLVDVTSVNYPSQVKALTLEVDITVENPCLDTSERKFLELLHASEIIFPIGSKKTHVDIAWVDEINFDQTFSLTKSCGTPELDFIFPEILQGKALIEDEP